ncbi:hypothetical protein D9M72_567370 [compost metagenome]
MADGAGLTRQARTFDGADDVVLRGAVRNGQRLGDHHAQHGTSEVNFLVLAVDGDLAGARLDPNASDRVLALAGRVGAALGVQLLLVNGSVVFDGAQALQGVEAGGFSSHVGHAQALRVFLAEADLKSMVCGCWASCSWAAPANRRRCVICLRASGLSFGSMRSTAFSSTRSGKRPPRTFSGVVCLMPPG